jgi:hypothetical protein
MIKIEHNGSKFSGQAPDPIEKLFERLEKYTLVPSLVPFMSDAAPDCGPGCMRFFGNFVEVSGAFAVVTDDEEMMKRFVSAIGSNMQTPRFVKASREYKAEQKAKAERANVFRAAVAQARRR